MTSNQKPSVSSLPTVCEVEEVLIGLLNNNNGLPKYDFKTARVLSSWMCNPQRTPEDVYELIGPKFENLQGCTENKLTQSFLAAVVLDALGVISERKKIVLIGHWAKIAQCIIKYLYDNNKGENVGDFNFHPSNLHRKESSWILSACNTDICPDDALRLEMFGLIWAKNYLDELTTEQTVEFFVQTISELDSDIVYNNHAHDLLFSAEDLWVCFDRFDEESYSWLDQMTPINELTDMGQKITESLLYYEYSREVKFLQNILKLTGILAQIARFRFQSKCRLLRKWLNDCLTLFIHKFKKFFKDGMEKFAQICLHPFIYPYYIDLIYNITNSMVDLSGKLNKWRKNKKLTKCRQDKFRRLETRRNYMVYSVDPMSPPMNLPPLLMKQELGLLNPSTRAKLQRKVFSQPILPLSFNYSKDRVEFNQYNDQLTNYDFLNLDDANDDEESDDDDDVWETDNSEDFDSDVSSDNGNFENELTIRRFIRNVFRSIANEGEIGDRIGIAESENASDDTGDSNSTDTDDTTGGNLADFMRRLNYIRNDEMERVISAVHDASNETDTDDASVHGTSNASVDPNSDEDDSECMVQ